MKGEFDLFFILTNSPNLKKFLSEGEYVECNDVDNSYTPHVWTPHRLSLMAKYRNMMVKHVLDNNYDYFFSVDSDLVLQPDTLQHLVSLDKDIVGEVLWTEWKEGIEQPNAWMSDYYEFGNFPVELFRQPGLYKVGMVCCCCLINRRVLLAGVNYSPVYNLSFTMWEDRALCVRAAVHGFDIYLDTNYPAIHLYHN